MVIIILAMLMTYSIVLSRMGYDPKILTGVTAAMCGLAVRVVRRLMSGAPPPQPPPLTDSGDL